MSDRLSRTDVIRLLHDKSTVVREETAAKLVADFNGDEITDGERRIAEDILRIMVHDTAIQVRQVLSDNLKDSSMVPRDIASALARDVDTVALPVLEFSKVLTDQDLIDVVRTRDRNKQTAIARRTQVSAEVSDALVEDGGEDVVVTLLENEGADIAERAMQKVLDTYAESEAVKTKMTQRSRLPITVAERLVVMVSDSLKEYLLTHHEVSPDVASNLILQARERATTSWLADDAQPMDVETLVRHLDENARLTPSIILRALCVGDMTFFEASLARRAGIPVLNAQKLIHDPGGRGLESLLSAADIPENMFSATRVAVEVAHETDYDGGDNDRERYRRRMVERILTQYADIDAPDLEYLLGMLAAQAGSASQHAAA